MFLLPTTVCGGEVSSNPISALRHIPPDYESAEYISWGEAALRWVDSEETTESLADIEGFNSEI
jgi:hypothetical protein